MTGRASFAAMLLFAGFGCHRAPPQSAAIDPSLAACVPRDAQFIAGVDLAGVRSWPLYRALPDSLRATITPVASAHTILLASGGKDLWIAARGPFASPPAGAITPAPGVALYGVPEPLTPACKTGRPVATPLLAQAESIAAGAPLWAVAQGGAPLPLPQNFSNAAGVLRRAQFLTLTIRRANGLSVELRALAPDQQTARVIEETLRADLTLAAAAEAGRPDAAAALRAATVTRAAAETKVNLSLSDSLLAGFVR